MGLTVLTAYAGIACAVFAALAFLRIDVIVIAIFTRRVFDNQQLTRRDKVSASLCLIALVMGGISLYRSHTPAEPPFTVTGIGCTPTNATGNGGAGTFALEPGPCTAVMVTMGSALGAPNGWHCDVGDRTQLARGIFLPQWIEQASTKTTVTIPIPRGAYQDLDSKGNTGTDVISFACTRY
jgi:hypothetical protein